MNAPKRLSPSGQAAVGYASRFRWAVFPLHTLTPIGCSCGKPKCANPGKHPRTRHGLNDATTDQTTIMRWWSAWPDANIGVGLGKSSGVIAVDVDPRHDGHVTLADLEAQHGQLPDTVEAITGGSGRHVLFACPEGGCPTRDLGPGLELRGDGAYIVVAPSLHASGRRYEWEAAHHPDGVPLARLPAWVLSLAKATDGNGAGPGSKLDLAQVLAGVAEGQRDTTLFKYACRLRAKGMAREEAEVLVLEAAARCDPPFLEDSARQKVANAWKYPSTMAEREAALADARDLAIALPDCTKADPGAPFEPKTLHALVLIHEFDPPAWARLRAALAKAGVSMRDLDRALRVQDSRGGGDPPDDGGPDGTDGCSGEPDPYRYWDAPSGLYAVRGGRTYRVAYHDGHPELHPLGNFAAHIAEETDLDDGAEVRRFYTIEGRHHSSRPLPAIRVPVERYLPMNWPAEHWGHGPSIAAGQGNRDHLRAAVDEFSGDSVPHRTVYVHMGWRRAGDGWVYLHAGGAIGAEGVDVDLDPELQRYTLPAIGSDAVNATRLSLDFLDLGDPRATFPLWAAVWRAVVCEWLPFLLVLWLKGDTGTLKSSTAAVALSHFGGPFDKDSLPASWLDTDNRLELRAFLAKDTLLVVDDFCPERQADLARRMQERAARLIRGVGNRQGRGRLRADLTARPTYIPRGLVVATAEQLPQLANSALARILPVPFESGSIDKDKLSRLQHQSAALPHALVGFVEHLRTQADGLGERLRQRFEELRDKARIEGHDRLPEAVAHLYVGLELGIGYAVHVGALDEARGSTLLAQGWEVFMDLARDHAKTLADERPARLFLDALSEGLAGEACWLADRGTGGAAAGVEDAGKKLGWADGDGLYLLPQTAYEFAADHLRHRGGLTITDRALWEMIRKDGLIVRHEEGRLTAKVRCEGVPQRVLWLLREAFGELPAAEVRQAVCWSCMTEMSSDRDRRCPHCGWMVCPACGSCKQGCAA